MHRGFRDGYIQLQRGVLSSVSDLMTRYPTFPVLVTGHSLGAAEACMASIDLRVTLGARVTAFTFGEPRVGNKAFSEYYRFVFSSTLYYLFFFFFFLSLNLSKTQMIIYIQLQVVWTGDAAQLEGCGDKGHRAPSTA